MVNLYTTRFSAAAIATLFSAKSTLTSAISENAENCESIENLGSNNLDQFEYSLNMDIDDDCSYNLEIKFKHDDTLPIPESGSQCDPSIVPPAIASDGLPYFAFRWAYESVPMSVKEATGLDHISLDFNPCGHPPLDAFAVPHYDFHLYMVDPGYRTCMTCDKLPGAPVCSPFEQTTTNGNAFFSVARLEAGPDMGSIANMPSGYAFGQFDVVPLMGSHCWDVSKQPNASNPWVDPFWIMGTYDGKIINYEPMIPLSWMSGSEDKMFEESFTYVGQSIDELPTKYSIEYDSDSGFVTVLLEGNSAVCKEKEIRSIETQTKSSKKAKKEKKTKKSKK